MDLTLKRATISATIKATIAIMIVTVIAATGVTRAADIMTKRVTGETIVTGETTVTGETGAIGGSNAIMVAMAAATGIMPIAILAMGMAGANIATVTIVTDFESGAFTGNAQ
jgi:hypothetical protein